VQLALPIQIVVSIFARPYFNWEKQHPPRLFEIRNDNLHYAAMSSQQDWLKHLVTNHPRHNHNFARSLFWVNHVIYIWHLFICKLWKFLGVCQHPMPPGSYTTGYVSILKMIRACIRVFGGGHSHTHSYRHCRQRQFQETSCAPAFSQDTPGL